MNSHFTAFLFTLVLIFSCKKEEPTIELIPKYIPIVNTTVVKKISKSMAICFGEIINYEKKKLKVGVRWYESNTKTWYYLNDDYESYLNQFFMKRISGLNPKTKYFTQAYAIYNNDTTYGDTLNFTTMPIDWKVFDIDGKQYNTVEIGTQVWLKENLKVTKFNNGDAISMISRNEWSNNTKNGYCNYYNDTSLASVYGYLYNIYVIIDDRNVCPDGWHIPSKSDWKSLLSNLRGADIAGGKLKEEGSEHWAEPNTDATNESNFTALPGGSIGRYGSIYNIGVNGNWWSSTTKDIYYNNNYYQTYISLSYYSAGVEINNYAINSNNDTNSGLSVRCLMNW